MSIVIKVNIDETSETCSQPAKILNVESVGIDFNLTLLRLCFVVV